MKSLYIRIVLTFVMIALVSSIFGLLMTSLYYELRLKSDNEQKIMTIGENIRSLYEPNMKVDLDTYLTHIAALGFQIYAVHGNLQGKVYGSAFKHGQLSDAELQSVLDGGVYHGMSVENHRIQIIAFFENSIRNTVGIPIDSPDGKVALFIRPDLQKQIGEVRIIVAVLLGSTFLISLLLIIVFSRFIVRPIKELTKATQRIVKGNFNVGLEVSRKDEIGDLANHFSHMTRSIQQLDQMRQEFVANVSHEFQTPLTSIQGFVRAVLDKETTPEESERYLTIIEEESRRLSSLSKQLLTLAALDKEDKGLQKSEFRLDEQIRQIIIMLEWQWSEKSLQLDLDLPEVMIVADAQLLYEVWLNLISNSIKFCESGDTISIRITSSDEETIEVEIGDTGIGVPEEDIPFLFERFHKVDKIRQRSSTGSGLGLSIVQQVVTLHQGNIQLQSQYGSGTTITVTLPRL
ncbi:two-component sensor histidine kinase [Paenibacillus baekrokdamisoli]|uniref:Heme sensor protein HssS n=1 Tax=Paenibacillus baekrokdamisoli TaxID=1712516 RepID=A0A3G9JD98_9BACL|nr:HAMP domain-containing sensor histidine kinase [Paenibacillus baekrokdamisoli]MBB3067999.1 signal transduction histidine kinase [Paenibacillus baekrokdamisoli]BBH22953.1 two-component sensor histidine kinase [Paenibacillus baekrokdamisoli]